MIVSIIIPLWVIYAKTESNLAAKLSIIKPESYRLQQKLKFMPDDSLVQYALQKINEDRTKSNLSALNLSSNEAAQVHAEEIFNSRSNSTHWSTDGMKPYMKYSLYSGTGYVQQNIATRGYNNNSTVDKCKDGTLLCDLIDPYREIDFTEQSMMYDDTECCNDGHRDNILDKHHTHVSIGIAYDDYYFVIVQNFENNYVQFNKPLIQGNGNIRITGMLPGYNIDGIGIHYDQTPSPLLYEKNKDENSYDLGEFIAMVVKPPPLLSWYKEPSNYTLVQATKWSEPEQSVDIIFDISPILKKEGVYTVVTYIKDNEKNQFPVTSYPVFVK
jgi:uncharacterized protein YkwD